MLFDAPSPFAPLPGTTPPPRALFIDRWGTLLATPDAGFARKPSELSYIDGAVDALFRATRAHWKIYLLGNEESVYFGRLPLEDWKAVEAEFLSHLAGAGVAVARSYACLQHPEGVAGQRGDSVYQLPNTGAFYHAHHTDGIELAKSWVIGDSTLELVAGWRAGCRVAGVRTGQALADATFHVEAELLAADLGSAIAALLERQATLNHP